MNTKLALLALIGLSTINSQLSTSFAQGSLTPPPGPPAPVMKSLDQIEARTPITNRASTFTITQPGSYYLTGNLTVSSGDGIFIVTNGVTLDLNGFTIRSIATSATGSGIRLTNSLRNIAIANGFIQSGVTNNGSGVFSGPGFGSGISYPAFSPSSNVRVSNISVSGCLNDGIALPNSSISVVESCTVAGCGGVGISGSTIKSCVAYGCGGTSIDGFSVSDSRGESIADYGISANTVQNSIGRSTTDYGISCESAMNSHGASSSGTGLWATGTAMNCRGQSTSGTGLRAGTAMNCSGSSSSGGGLSADVAMNCIGNSLNSTGLSATIANSCRASSYVVTHNINSF